MWTGFKKCGGVLQSASEDESIGRIAGESFEFIEEEGARHPYVLTNCLNIKLCIGYMIFYIS